MITTPIAADEPENFDVAAAFAFYTREMAAAKVDAASAAHAVPARAASAFRAVAANAGATVAAAIQ